MFVYQKNGKKYEKYPFFLYSLEICYTILRLTLIKIKNGYKSSNNRVVVAFPWERFVLFFYFFCFCTFE